MDHLPETGFLRLKQIIGDAGRPQIDGRRAIPPIPALIPVSKSTWWAGVKSGRYPKSTKLSPRITAWDVRAIRDLITRLQSDGAA
jgi:predicted DNA-binding transcriptional regulator AlpA